jgi:Nidogen-like
MIRHASRRDRNPFFPIGRSDLTGSKVAAIFASLIIAACTVLLAPHRAAAQCSGDATALLFPLDSSYALVDFFGDGQSEEGSVGADQRNDDDSATVPLDFTYDLYGDQYTAAFVNNNGNLSFVTPFSEFTAEGFPSDQFQMVAPFWADVDTRNPDSGQAWMRQFDSNGDGHNDTLVVTWDNVGYFQEHVDLRNTFQVAISDGTNPVMGLGNNVCFSWDNMCWTTGEVSDGDGGFGGVAATVGANRGNGTDFFQIGRFDQPGTAYDGPGMNNDGVDFLDHSTTCFSTATLTTNIAPIPAGFPVSNHVELDACSGDSLTLPLQFLSPELGQTTTVQILDPAGAQAAGLLIANTPGNVAKVSLSWPSPQPGTYVLQMTATDNFVVPGVTTIDLVIDVTVHGNPTGTCNMALCGDPDRNGTITVTDGTLAFRTATDLLSPCVKETCDMTGTGLPITVSDGVNILRLAAGLAGLAACPVPALPVSVRSESPSGDLDIGRGAARATVPPSAALAKLAAKCQSELSRQAVKSLSQGLGPLDRCISGVLKCVETATDTSACLAKATPNCVDKAAAKLAKSQQGGMNRIVKRCSAIDLGELRDGTGLGYADVSDDCSTRQFVDLCSAEEISQCLVGETSRNATAFYGTQAPRARELYRLVRPEDPVSPEPPLLPPDPFADLPAFGDQVRALGPAPADGKAIQKCALSITKAGDKFVLTSVAVVEKCLAKLFTCQKVKPEDPGCLAAAQTKCATQIDKLSQSTKFEDAVRKGCGDLPFASLAQSDGLNLGALDPTCAALGISTPLTNIDDYVACASQSHQCRLLDLMRFSVPRGTMLLPDVLLAAFHADRCPSPRSVSRAIPSVSGILRFIRSVLRVGGVLGSYRRGLAPASTGSGRSITQMSASRFAPRGLSNRLFIHYTRGVTRARATATGDPLSLVIKVQRTDNSDVPDYFELPLPSDPAPGQVSNDCSDTECAVAVDLIFPDDLRGCVFNVLAAAAEGGTVGDYKGVEQVPAGPLNPATQQEVVLTIRGISTAQAFRLDVTYPQAKGEFVGGSDEVACQLTGNLPTIFVANHKEDDRILTITAGSASGLVFPLEVHCTFDLTVTGKKMAKLKSTDFGVAVTEATVGGLPGDKAAVTATVTLP